MREKPDVYSRVTGKIVADLERGNLTWWQPWHAGHQAAPYQDRYAPQARLTVASMC
jgi:antirestriction protein ArdC